MGNSRDHKLAMGDCAADLEKTIMPIAVAGGIYDFSGTQASHVYAETGINVTVAEIQELTKGWWDGTAEQWSTDEEFNEAVKKMSAITIGGEEFRVMRRSGFGDGDKCHVVVLKSKKPNSKRNALVAHSDYTCCIGIGDDEQEKPVGPLNIAVQGLMEAYQISGY